jgi:hypothetical protein
MKRKAEKVPGYDCGWHGEKCQHERKGEHGISGGYYLYSVVAEEGDVAVVFTVHAAEYPDTIEEPRRSQCIASATADAPCFYHVHAAFPLEMSQVGGEPIVCAYLPGGSCYGDGGHFSGASEILQAHGRPGAFEQPEAFWLELEEILADRAQHARANRADLVWKVCPECGGTDHPGFVKVKQEREEPSP